LKGSGIGRATAIAFAAAGAKRLILIGRTEASLQETASLVSPKSKVEVYPASVTNEIQVGEIASKVGAWDVLILNAAHLLTPSTVIGAKLNDWWTQYEVSVKAVVVVAQAFVPSAKPGAALYGITAGALVMPPSLAPGCSAYLTAKTAQIKVLEYLASEHPDLFVVSVHPGMIETDVFRSSGADPQMLPMDTGRCRFQGAEHLLTESDS
jgi:NAD(P)-dependent dehydrogenase (short-subunit alcohol dehydrogenase family)